MTVSGLLARQGKPPWSLTATETANLEIVARATRELALLFITSTQLQKSIIDATATIRTLLKQSGFHDFDVQSQGEEHKVTRTFRLVTDDDVLESSVTMYRPVTKKGDPRLWFLGMRSHLSTAHVLALFVNRGRLTAIDITSSNLATGRSPAAQRELDDPGVRYDSVADELLTKLKRVAERGFIPAVGHGDTAIGRTLEAALGIAANSSKAPDYRGIELKTKRSLPGRSRPRSNLFAQVPDWTLSPFKSSEAIVKEFGYHRNGLQRLNCTVEIGFPNSQGLFLKIQAPDGQLQERHGGSPSQLVAVWLVATLQKRLLEKHAETFWIEADSEFRPKGEYFAYRRVQHTRAPSLAMFDAQLAAGSITVDHLIKIKNGKAHERGPLFKIRHNALRLLFPRDAIVYDLLK